MIEDTEARKSCFPLSFLASAFFIILFLATCFMRKICLTLICTFSVCFLFAQSSQGIVWQRPLGGSSGDSHMSTVTTPDGNYIMASESFSTNGDVSGAHGGTDTWITKITPDGQMLWQRALGSSGQDFFQQILPSPDGGCLVFMYPGANNGDVTGYRGLNDIWAVKLSSSGAIEWKRCFGGSSNENFVQAVQDSEGNVLVCGNTFSTDGDFTMNHSSSADIFIIKLSYSGTVYWIKTFGGTDSDTFDALLVKSNGNYMVGGRSFSTNGDIPGNNGSIDLIFMEIDKNGNRLWSRNYGGTGADNFGRFLRTGETFTCLANVSAGGGNISTYRGGTDFWLLTIDSTGALVREKTYGGSANETSPALFFLPSDSSLILAGNTLSSNGDITGYHGGRDVWMAKLNKAGVLQWSRSLGGSAGESFSTLILQTPDEATFFAHTASSDGDVTGYHGGNDIWVVKINTATGGTIWSRTLGGSLNENLKAISTHSGNGIIIGADVQSKDGDITGAHYRVDTLVGDTSTTYTFYNDMWVAYLAQNGSLKWQKALGGFDNEYLGRVFTMGNDVLVVGTTHSKNGDVFKNHGGSDLWVVRLGPSNEIKGTLFLDRNSNGVKDAGEPFFSDAVVTSSKPGYQRSSMPYNGLFQNQVDTGTYATTVQVLMPYYTAVPASINSSFSAYFQKDSISFAIQPIPGKKDLVIHALPLTPARPGFEVSYRVQYKNVGTEAIPSGKVLFKKDSRLTLVSASPANNSTSGDTLVWNYTNLGLSDTASILLRFRVPAPPGINLGDTLTSIAIITPVSGDETPGDDTAVLKQRVIGSYDPNDKTERNAGRVPSTFVTKGDFLQYVIRFQNTGTDTAFNVTVRDTLDARLDWNSLQMIASSHRYRMSVDDGNKLAWTFSNINLPDSNVNEPASHGYIVYRIRPRSTVAANEVIHNTASIYFDFNLPVRTNDASTLVRDDLTVLPVVLVEFGGRMNGRTAELKWKTEDAASLEQFEVQRSLDGREYTTIGKLPSRGASSSYNFSDDLSPLSAPVVYYRLKMVELDGKTSFSQVLVFREKGVGSQLLVYPNPVKGSAFISFMSPSKARIELQLTDASGRLVLRRSCDVEKGNNILSLGGLERFKPGSYSLQLVNGTERLNSRIVIQ